LIFLNVTYYEMDQKVDQEFLNKISKRIKDIREERKITQEAFYMDTNIHIGRIERGMINLKINTLNTICKYFGITLKDFFNSLE
jgi:transcriptional regulator with XRE-family HTH domain